MINMILSYELDGNIGCQNYDICRNFDADADDDDRNGTFVRRVALESGTWADQPSAGSRPKQIVIFSLN